MKKKVINTLFAGLAISSMLFVAACGNSSSDNTNSSAVSATDTTTEVSTTSNTTTTADIASDKVYEIYLLAKQSGYSGSYEEWLESIKGDVIELQVANGYVQWKYKTASEWINLLKIADLVGASGNDGKDGKSVELRQNEGYIEWRYVGESDDSWTKLLALKDLTGSDGKSIELRQNEGAIEWRYVGGNDDSWAVLATLDSLKGDTGVGIESAEIDGDGYLIITYTDGTVINAGLIVRTPKEEHLDYYLYPDGTYGVSAGKSKYLDEIIIPETYNGVAVTRINECGFEGCKNLTKITIPDTITEIGEYAFNKCKSLTSITIPDTVKIIPEYTFSECESLTEVIIPNSVTVYSWAFMDCYNLENVYLSGRTNELNVAIDNDELMNSAIYLYTSNGADETELGEWWYYNETGEIVTLTLDGKRHKPADLSTLSKLYIVGDTTVDGYLDSNGNPKDISYFYEKCGWGEHIDDYSEKIEVVNYGISGYNSVSYTDTNYYNEIKENLSEGDYLMIGFAHSDEAYYNANYETLEEALADTNSFQYSLYNNYIKPASEAGATPILCTPICRIRESGDYTGSAIHVTGNGDFRQAIVDLGQAYDVKVIDLTTYTKDLFTTLGYDEACYFFAMQNGTSQTTPDLKSINQTVTNSYGSKTIDYYIASQLYADNNCYLGNYIQDEITAPTKEKDLVINPTFEYVGYEAPDLLNYTPVDSFKTISDGWYGTAFGDTGGTPETTTYGYTACETEKGKFTVGQSATSYRGKITDSAEGIACAFMQLDLETNFMFTCQAKVTAVGDTYYDGFGIQLRDACWLPTQDIESISDYVAAGVYRSRTDIMANFSRQSSLVTTTNILASYPAVGDVLTLTINKNDEGIEVTTKVGDTEHKNEYVDFALDTIDTDYMYLTMFATRGTVVEFSSLSYSELIYFGA